MEHDIKALPEYFQAVKRGAKPFELRRDDRNYSVGDCLKLREWDGEYTGEIWRVRVTYTLRGGEWLTPGYVAMGIRAIAKDNAIRVQEDFRAVADRLRAELEGAERRYQSAVHGRAKFREAFRKARTEGRAARKWMAEYAVWLVIYHIG